MAGRPTKRTLENRAIICEALEQGDTYRGACLRAGLSDETFGEWRKDDLDFLEAVKEAEAKCRARMIATISTAARKGVWTAAAWWLERRHPDEFRRHDKHEVTGAGGGPIQTATLSLNDLVHDDEGRKLLLSVAARLCPTNGDAAKLGNDAD